MVPPSFLCPGMAVASNFDLGFFFSFLLAGDDFADIEREIMMLKDCRHPNIVAYYESYLRRGNLSICMEYCGGGSIMDIYRGT